MILILMLHLLNWNPGDLHWNQEICWSLQFGLRWMKWIMYLILFHKWFIPCTSWVWQENRYRFCWSWVSISLLPNCLIALDIRPDVCPIGVGESLRHILGRANLWFQNCGILNVFGNDQLCAGQDGGCVSAVHTVCRIFDLTDCEAVLLNIASNTFNALNR